MGNPSQNRASAILKAAGMPKSSPAQSWTAAECNLLIDRKTILTSRMPELMSSRGKPMPDPFPFIILNNTEPVSDPITDIPVIVPEAVSAPEPDAMVDTGPELPPVVSDYYEQPITLSFISNVSNNHPAAQLITWGDFASNCQQPVILQAFPVYARYCTSPANGSRRGVGHGGRVACRLT